MGKILAYIIKACEEQHHGPFELFLLVLLFSPPPFNLFSLVKKISISVFIMFSDACEREKKDLALVPVKTAHKLTNSGTFK